MDVRLIALLLLLVSCMPSATVTRNGIAEDGTNTETTSGSGNGSGGSVAVSEIGWNYLGSNSLSISIDAANLNTAYLTGTDIQNYLSTSTNFNNVNYCVAASFDIGGVIYELRARAVPISYYDFTKQQTVRVFRVDYPDATNSSSFCSGTLFIQDSSGSYIADTSGALSPVFNAGDLCPTCTTLQSSSRVRVYKKESTIRQIPSSLLKFDSLVLKIDPNNNSTNNPTTCSQSTCVARGFDCCLDNQCVDEGKERPSAATQYPALLSIAKEAIVLDRLAYLQYPQLYYICGTTPSTTSGSGSGSGTPDTNHDPVFQQTKKDYFCLKNLQSQATLSTYHKELLTDSSWNPSTDCLTDAVADKDKTQYYLKVVERLYKNCECGAGPLLSEKINGCPAYEYKVVLGTETEPLQFQCDPPPSDGTTQLPTQMTVSVSGRAAPHRYFEEAGTQEGDSFSYTDSENLFPSQSTSGIPLFYRDREFFKQSCCHVARCEADAQE